MLRLAAIVCLLAGCDVVWRLDDLRSTDGGGSSSDGPRIDVNAPPCTDRVHDEFAGTTISQQWMTFAENAGLQVRQAETLVIDIQANITANGEAGVSLNIPHLFDPGATASVEAPLVTLSSSGHVETYLAVRQDYLNGYFIDVSDASIEFLIKVNGAMVQMVGRPYESQAHRFWRILHGPSSDQVSFQTSADGISWFTQLQANAVVPLGVMQIALVAGTFSGGDPTATRAAFDNFELCNAPEVL
ncbi:MAG TPA: hypothetical protein VIV40_40185 [Kofleriaceae bacterium]